MNETGTTYMHFRMPNKAMAATKYMAAKQGIPVSAMIKQALEAWARMTMEDQGFVEKYSASILADRRKK